MQSGTNPGGLDARAQAVVDAAAAAGPEADRAVQAVRSIIATYFAADAGLVANVVFDARVVGLSTASATGPTATGVITVGRQFLEGTTSQHFGRRVVQVDHELEHVRQHRRGMGGPAGSAEREYLAFRREAMATPPTGAGRLQHSERVSLIDAALSNYCRLTPQLQTQHAQERDDLLAMRAREQTASGNPPTAAPVCSPPPTQSPQQPRQGHASATVQARPDSEAPRFGLDVALSGSLATLALDTYDPAAPTTPRGLTLRGGGQPGGGDTGANVAVLAVWRDRNFATIGSGLHVGHELQGQVSAGVTTGVPTGFALLGAAGSIDVFHRQFSSVLGKFDWHALTAQAFANLGVPFVRGSGDVLQLGGGLGTGLELHPGKQDRFSVTAALMLSGQDTINLQTGAGAGSGTLTFTLTLTANLINP